MRICDLTTGVNALRRATKRLRDKWTAAQGAWEDKASRQFAEQYLDPLVPQVNLMVAAVNRLSEVLERAEQECEDRPVES